MFRKGVEMTDLEVERRLGYTPCVCGKLDGTWHAKCYRGLSEEEIAAAYKRAFSKARRYIKKTAETEAQKVVRAAAAMVQP